MSDYRELVAILKEILTNRFYPMPQFTHGLLGDGNGNVEVPGRPDYNFVRFSRTTETVFQVFNKEVSQPVDNWPVLIGELPWQPGLVQVVATDWNTYIQTKWGNNVASIQTHAPTHEWPTFAPGSDAVNVYPRALTPLRAQSGGSGSNAVFVNPYEYDWTGTSAQWPGVPAMDFSTKPPTGSMLYMGIYLNPTTNALGVVSGSTTVFTDALEPALPNWPLGVYPSGYVRLYGGQAMITERDIRPAQRLYQSTQVFTGTSTGVGGGWPFAQILTVSLADPDANFPTLAAAVAIANNQTILLDSETYTITDQSLANTITLTGVLGQTVISGSVASGATLTIANISTFLRFLRVSHTGGGTLSGAILTDQDATFLERLIIRKTTGAPTTGYGVHITGGASSGSYLLDCDVSVTSGTNRYGVLIDTAASITVIDGGEYNSTTADILVNHASANVTLKGPRLRGGGLTVTAGTVKGWYLNSNGDVITVNTSGVSGGVWRYRPDGLRFKEADIPTAYANCATGDEVHIFPGTYSITGLSVATLIHLIGEGDPRSIIVTSSDAFTFAPTIAGVTFTGFTINNTHASGTDGVCVQWQVNNIIFTDMIFNKTGAADDAACLLQYGGTGAQIIDTAATASGATRNYAYWNNTAVATCEIIGGALSGTTQDILSDQASTIQLNKPKLVNSLISLTGGATLTGSYLDTNGGQFNSLETNVWRSIDFELNYIITPSVATNDLTVALKTLSGNDPTVKNRLTFKIGSTWRDVTAALTFTKNDGTNWMALGAAETATQDTDVFMYVMYETGASAGVKSFISRIPYGRTMADFVNTTTSEKYPAGGWTNFNATDEVTCIGRLNVALSATAAFNWSLPTQVVINRPILETRWLVYVPAVSALSGTITTVGAVAGQYQIGYNKLAIAHNVAVTTNGTGATGLVVSLPFTPILSTQVFVGSNNNTNTMIRGGISGATIFWLTYNALYPIASGQTIQGNGLLKI